MEIVTFMNTYGITAMLAGLSACIVCGVLKIPIAKVLKKHSVQKDISEKIAADKLRNVCNIIVLMACVVFVSAWYGVKNGANIFLTAEFYTEILTAFTAAKIIYIIYEGAGKVSIKKQLQLVVAKILSKRRGIGASQNMLTVVQKYLTEQAELPLTEEQLQGLGVALNTIKTKTNKETD